MGITLAGTTLFASSCGMQVRDALFEAGTDFVNALADDFLQDVFLGNIDE